MIRFHNHLTSIFSRHMIRQPFLKKIQLFLTRQPFRGTIPQSWQPFRNHSSWCYYHYQANCPTCRTEIREIRDLSMAAVLHEFAIVEDQPQSVVCSDAFVHEQRTLAKQHHAAAATGARLAA